MEPNRFHVMLVVFFAQLNFASEAQTKKKLTGLLSCCVKALFVDGFTFTRVSFLCFSGQWRTPPLPIKTTIRRGNYWFDFRTRTRIKPRQSVSLLLLIAMPLQTHSLSEILITFIRCWIRERKLNGRQHQDLLFGRIYRYFFWQTGIWRPHQIIINTPEPFVHSQQDVSSGGNLS